MAFQKGHKINQGMIPWNKGLTKGDLRVRKYCFNSGNFKKGLKHSKEWFENMKTIMISNSWGFKKGHIPPFKNIKGIHLSPKTEFKKGEMTGEKNNNWNGGTSFLPYTPEFNDRVKFQIRQRDKFTCQECGYTEEQLSYNLCVHHIDFNKKNSNPNNLISLCKSCHSKTQLSREEWIEYFQDKILITMS